MEKQVDKEIDKMGGWQQIRPSVAKGPPMQMSSGNNMLINVVLICALLFGLFGKTNSLTAYDCHKPKMATIYSLVDTMECPQVYPHKIDPGVTTIYVYQEMEFHRTTVRDWSANSRI